MYNPAHTDVNPLPEDTDMKDWKSQAALAIAIAWVAIAGNVFGADMAKSPQSESRDAAVTPYDYAPMLPLLQHKDGPKLRFPTTEEMGILRPLWPTVPWRLNAAYYYVKAARTGSRVEDPWMDVPGSATCESFYKGDKKLVEEYVGQHAEAVRLMREALALPVYRPPPVLVAEDWEPKYMEVMIHGDGDVPPGQQLPGGKRAGELALGFAHLSGMRHLARICTDAAFVAELGGRHDEAADWYLCCIGMGRQLRRGGDLIGSFVGSAVTLSMGCPGLRSLIANQHLSDDMLRRIVAECRAAEVLPEELVNVWDREVVLQRWELEGPCRDHGWDRFVASRRSAWRYRRGEEPMPPIAPEEAMRYLRASRPVVRRILSQPPAKLACQKGAIARQLEARLPPPSPALAGICNKLVRWPQALARVNVSLRAMEVHAAMALYERVRGAPPERLDALVPGFLPAVPEDPFTGKPLRYATGPYGWKVWSVGPDGKDDGGRCTLPHTWKSYADYVFYSKVFPNEDYRRGYQYSIDADERFTRRSRYE